MDKNPEDFLDIGEGSEIRITYDALRSIADIEIDDLFPDFAKPNTDQTQEFRLPDLQRTTLRTLNKLKVDWEPVNGTFLRNIQRISVYLLNKTSQEHSINKKKVRDAVYDFVMLIDHHLRQIYIPGSKHDIFSQHTVEELDKIERELLFYKKLLTEALEEIVPIHLKLREETEKYEETMSEIEQLEKMLKDHPKYKEEKVDSEDYTQNLLLYNVASLLS